MKNAKRSSVAAKRLSPNPMDPATKSGLKTGVAVVAGGLAVLTGLVLVTGLVLAKKSPGPLMV
jgi:hypothetical protein